MGSVGDSYDNALAETINGLCKAEVIHRCGPWRSMEAVEYATLEWVDWFNTPRLLEPIGSIPPAEAEAAYYADMNEQAIAAWLKPNSLRGYRGGSFWVNRDMGPPCQDIRFAPKVSLDRAFAKLLWAEKRSLYRVSLVHVRGVRAIRAA